jgi:hypothetical protein
MRTTSTSSLQTENHAGSQLQLFWPFAVAFGNSVRQPACLEWSHGNMLGKPEVNPIN